MMRSSISTTLITAISIGSACSNTNTQDGTEKDARGDTDAPTGAGDIDGGVAPDANTSDTTPVRFIAMGDTGTGSESQYKVGAAIADVCATRGCDFVIMLGDNFYDAGVDSVDDPLWQEYFELPYAPIPDTIPFYAVLGNHDYGGTLDPLPIDASGIGNEFDKGPIEVAYSDSSDKWTMPSTFYTLRKGNVGFMMLDTNSIMWDDISNGDQEAWYAQARAELDGARWVFGAGHHPYLSNGRHGNAGSYESIEVAGIELPNPVELLNGDNIKTFFDAQVCGTVDVYFSGHDHNLQWVEEPDALCGAPMIVSGAGAKTTDFESTLNTTLYQEDSKPGFAYVVVEGDTMTLEFIDEDGEVDFVKSITHD